MNNQTSNYSPSVQDYMLLNSFERIDNGSIEGGMCFLKNNEIAVIFCKGVIDVKEPAAKNAPAKLNNILFTWKSKASYDGYDGSNKFNLMMLLHIMGVVSIKDFLKIANDVEYKDLYLNRNFNFQEIMQLSCQC